MIVSAPSIRFVRYHLSILSVLLRNSSRSTRSQKPQEYAVKVECVEKEQRAAGKKRGLIVVVITVGEVVNM